MRIWWPMQVSQWNRLHEYAVGRFEYFEISMCYNFGSDCVRLIKFLFDFLSHCNGCGSTFIELGDFLSWCIPKDARFIHLFFHCPYVLHRVRLMHIVKCKGFECISCPGSMKAFPRHGSDGQNCYFFDILWFFIWCEQPHGQTIAFAGTWFSAWNKSLISTVQFGLSDCDRTKDSKFFIFNQYNVSGRMRLGWFFLGMQFICSVSPYPVRVGRSRLMSVTS